MHFPGEFFKTGLLKLKTLAGVDQISTVDAHAKTARRLRTLALFVCVFAAVAVVRMAVGASANKASNVTEQALNGVWTLKSLNGDVIGPDAASVIATQQITFRDGKLHGETRIRADSEAGTTALPFPDETVTKVVSSPDGRWLRVTWDGAFTVIDDHRIELRIGKAAYLATVTLRPAQRTIAFDHDTILTFRGEARYAALDAPSDHKGQAP